MNSTQENPFSSYSWGALLEAMQERRDSGQDSGPEWDLMMEEYEKHTGSTPYP